MTATNKTQNSVEQVKEVKLRFWNIKTNDWASTLNIYMNGIGEMVYLLGGEVEEYINPSCIVRMQYTGLHDKNGVEIYEGDIVRHREDNREIYYDFGQFQVRFESLRSLCNFNPDCYCDVEVIGNIYENPELLS